MPALSETIRIFRDSTLSPVALSEMLVRVARGVRDDAISKGLAPPTYQTYVDGVRRQNEEGARREIRYEYGVLPEAVAFALSFLKNRSPVLSGRFRRSFYMAVDGVFVAPTELGPRVKLLTLPYDAEITIGNTQPYSRKIDTQFIGKRRLHFSVPPGLFDDCVRALRREFPGTIRARRVYTMLFPRQYVLRTGEKRGRLVESPAIIIKAVV